MSEHDVNDAINPQALARLVSFLDADDDARIAQATYEQPYLAARLPLSDQHRIETAQRRLEALRALDDAVRKSDAESFWKSSADDQAIVDAWWAVIDLGCTLEHDAEKVLDIQAREARLRLTRRIGGSSPRNDSRPTTAPPPAPAEPSSARQALDWSSTPYPRVDLQIALMRGDAAAINAAAAALKQAGLAIPAVYESAVNDARNAIWHDAAKYANPTAAYAAARELVGLEGAARFRFGRERAGAERALAALEALRAALMSRQYAAAAREWSRLKTCWPGLLAPAEDAAGEAAFEARGRTLLTTAKTARN